ncbi:condensation domain-containing protein, partial [Pseudomonas syringae]|nr:AMP-binding protein [Pseudomonas syringae]
MEKATALNVVKRFVALPLDKRKAYYQKMSREGLSLGDLPVPNLWHPDMPPPALSHAQERQWFLWHMDPSSTAYHITAALRLRGALDIDALQCSFTRLIQRHACLRTRFAYEDETLFQDILADMPWALQTCVDEPGSAPQAVRIGQFIEAQNAIAFDLQAGPLLRAALLQMGPQDHVLVVVQHHIISDGVSMQIMVDELMQLYAGYRQGQEVVLEPLPIHYADYAIWQRSWMEAGEKQRQLDYWTGQLGAEQPVLALPHDFPRPQVFSYRGAQVDVNVGPALAQALARLATTQGVTLFMLLLASFQVLLHRYSGQSVIHVGVPVANRNRSETKKLVGFFVNTQVIKGEVDSLATFDQFLRQIKRNALDAQTFQDLPFEHLVDALQPERSLSHNPIFQVMFSHQVAQPHTTGSLALAGLTVEPVRLTNRSAQFDLTLDVFELSTGLSASLTYAQDLFEPATVARMGEHWVNLLQAIVADPGQRIADLPLLSRQERERTVQAWNATAVDYPRTVCLHQLIEAQVRRAPQAVALTFEGRHLSYGELNARANRLAHRLIEAGVGPEVPVGIAMPRSLDM